VPGIHPLNIDVISPSRVARWRPLVNWLLVVPHLLWHGLLSLGVAVVAFLGWFAIVLTGQLPDSWADYTMGVLRYQWRILAYLFGWAQQYPSFAPAAGYVDPGDYSAIFYCARVLPRRRLTVLIRAFLVIPHLLVLCFVSVAALVVLGIAWFAALITGRWPDRMRDFAVGWLRWTFRAQAYVLLVTDVFPPFGFEA